MIKKYSYFIITLAFIFIFIGCSIKGDITGKYSSKSNFFQFKSNHTFIYEYGYLHLYEHSVGKWQTIGKRLILLNSDIKSTIIPINVSNSLSSRLENNIVSIDVDIKGNHALEDYKCQIFINDSDYFIKRCDSLAFIPVKSPIYSIYFKFFREPQQRFTNAIPLPLVTEKYFTESELGNNLAFKINFSDTYFYYKAFNNDTLKFQGNAIKMFNPYKGKWEKILRVSSSTYLFNRYNDTSTVIYKFQ